MHTKTYTNLVLSSKHKKPILVDVVKPLHIEPRQIVVYCHGYKGFKDWGATNLLAEYFAKHNMVFIKFNFSHNGGTVEQPIDFPDLDAFANNNFTKELDDLQVVLDWIHQDSFPAKNTNSQEITLIGHSRGSGISIIKAAEDDRVDKLISWAGVSNFESRFPNGVQLEAWKKNKIAYIENSRTKQQMPIHVQLYEDMIQNRQRLSIQRAAKQLKQPHLIIHGTDDPTVALKEAKEVHQWSTNSTLEIIPQADHVFNAKHPWQEDYIPNTLKKVVDKSITFIQT